MGHIHNGRGVYGRLQKRLDRFPSRPPAPALYEILRMLYTEEEAEVGARMPIRFTDLKGIAKRTGSLPRRCAHPPPDGGQGARDGLRAQGKFTYILSPPSSLLRVRLHAGAGDLPQKEIARHMVAYAHDEPDFARAVFAGKTQFGRTLVHEDQLDPAELTQILDTSGRRTSSGRPRRGRCPCATAAISRSTRGRRAASHGVCTT